MNALIIICVASWVLYFLISTILGLFPRVQKVLNLVGCKWKRFLHLVLSMLGATSIVINTKNSRLVQKLHSFIRSWIIKYRRFKEKKRVEGKGDGIHSIFSSTTLKPLISRTISETASLSSQSDDENFALQSLLCSNIFCGADVLFLRELISVMEYAVKPIRGTSHLQILQEGSLSLSQNIEGKVCSTKNFKKGDIIGGTIDILAWLLGMAQDHFPNGANFQYSPDCKLILLASPYSLSFYKSSSTHQMRLCKIIRRLFTRLHRTTLTAVYQSLDFQNLLRADYVQSCVPPNVPLLLMHSTSGARQYCVKKEDASGPTNVDAVVAANEDEAKAIMDCISCMLDYKCPWAEGNEALKRVPSVLGTTPASLCPTPLPRGKVGDSLLSPRVVVIPAGEMLRFDSDNNDISAAHVYIVVSGRVSLGTSADCPSKADSSSGDGLSTLVQELQSLRTDSRKDVILGPGDVFGLLSIVSGSGAQPLHDSVVARAVDSNCRVLAVPLVTIEKHMRKRPECFFRVGELVLRSLPESVRFIDRFGSLLLVPAGELYSVRDSGDVAVLLSGRAQVLSSETASNVISDSVSCGLVCREGAVLCNYSPRGRHTPTSINSREGAQTLNFRCIRESLLFKIPGDAIRMLLPQFPALACTLVRSSVSPTTQGHGIPESSTTAMKAIAVVPISGSVPLTQFDSLLCAWMNEHGIAAVTVSSSRMKGELGDVLEDASEEEYALVVGSWLRRFKRDCSVLFLQCDWTQNHLWNVLCLDEADEMLLIANAVDAPQVSIAPKCGIFH